MATKKATYEVMMDSGSAEARVEVRAVSPRGARLAAHRRVREGTMSWDIAHDADQDGAYSIRTVTKIGRASR